MKARNFALTLIAASAMFAFACDDSDSNSCDPNVDKNVCVNDSTIKICVAGVWKESKCQTATPVCKLGACVVDSTAACTPGATQCLDATKLATCGADKKWSAGEVCPNGCDAEKKACKTEVVTGDAKCPVDANYVNGAAVPDGFQWCCDRTEDKKAWTVKDSKLNHSDCVEKCTIHPTDANKISCTFTKPTGSHMCDKALEDTYVVGAPVPAVYKYCCSTVQTNKAWAEQTGAIALWECPGGCVEDATTPGKMDCKKSTGDCIDMTGITMANLGEECTGKGGACVGGHWLYCFTKEGETKGKYQVIYCEGDTCTNSAPGSCGYGSCTKWTVMTKTPTAEACVKTEYEASCDASDTKKGSFCTNDVITNIACVDGFKCDNKAGFISCIPAE